MPHELGQVHPTVPLVHEGETIDVDEDLVPLIQRLWELGFTTEGCCQDFGESIEHNGHRSNTSPADRQHHADFHRGKVWLKLPEDDAVRLIAILGTSPEFAERVRRWTHPDAWQNVIHIFPTNDGHARRAPSAQLTFPREQLGALLKVLQDRR
ncbi:hypothetical protein [Actinomadura harenae]|uniref:hypothetical protein n=1 Tax=Actinomadura harenae TaxID=2483351 RepID=UPI0011C4930E|nr:hypothetical protein [Actinomadura harenae]